MSESTMTESTMSPSTTDDNSPVLAQLIPGSRVLYVVFGGLQGGIDIPKFEFFRSLESADASKLFIRDFSQCWYQNGLPGIARNVSGVADYLRRQINLVEPDRTVFLGNSMGGYAAILFASLLKMGRAIAIVPQTFVSPSKRIWYRDHRWKKQVFRMYLQCKRFPRSLDLKPIVARAPEVPIDIFVPQDNRLDVLHAQRLSHLPNTNVQLFDSGGHDLVRKLRDNGELHDLLRNV